VKRGDKATYSALLTSLQDINDAIRIIENNPAQYAHLIEALSVQGVDVKHIKETFERMKHYMEKLYDEFKKIDKRLGRIEMVVTSQKYGKDRRSFAFFEAVREYSHIIAIIVAVGTFLIAAVFGIKVG
jgi:hypothetical protein